jgi:FtsH-binding integral membrane protein
MSAGWETTINTGSPQQDQAMIQAWQQQMAAQGMGLQVTPLPQGGYHVKAVPMNALPPNQFGAVLEAQPPQQGHVGIFAAPGGAFSAAAGTTAQPWNAGAAIGIAPAQQMGLERVQYLRKVYGLLGASAAVAFGAGGLATSGVFGVESYSTPVGTIEVPSMVAAMLQSPVLMFLTFGALLASTFVAGWVSKVRVVNVIALFSVAALMGVQLAPMVWVAMLQGDLGMAASASPVRDAAIMTLSIFAGITGYVSITKKDFSYLRGFLSMASMALFAACLLTFVFQSEVFSLAVAGVGALITMAMLLYVTSYIFRNSAMDDPVGDALALLIEARNLFMFLLRLFMSSRD